MGHSYKEALVVEASVVTLLAHEAYARRGPASVAVIGATADVACDTVNGHVLIHVGEAREREIHSWASFCDVPEERLSDLLPAWVKEDRWLAERGWSLAARNRKIARAIFRNCPLRHVPLVLLAAIAYARSDGVDLRELLQSVIELLGG